MRRAYKTAGKVCGVPKVQLGALLNLFARYFNVIPSFANNKLTDNVSDNYSADVYRNVIVGDGVHKLTFSNLPTFDKVTIIADGVETEITLTSQEFILASGVIYSGVSFSNLGVVVEEYFMSEFDSNISVTPLYFLGIKKTGATCYFDGDDANILLANNSDNVDVGFNYSSRFDGVTSRITQIPTELPYNSWSYDVTFCVTGGTGTRRYLIEENNTSNDKYRISAEINASDQLIIYCGTAASGLVTLNLGDITEGLFYRATCTFNGVEVVAYVNDVELDSEGRTETDTSDITEFNIGTFRGDTSRFFWGAISSIKLYNYALTSEQIADSSQIVTNPVNDLVSKGSCFIDSITDISYTSVGVIDFEKMYVPAFNDRVDVSGIELLNNYIATIKFPELSDIIKRYDYFENEDETRLPLFTDGIANEINISEINSASFGISIFKTSLGKFTDMRFKKIPSFPIFSGFTNNSTLYATSTILQGICNDGTYYYIAISHDTIEKRLMSDWSFVDSNNQPRMFGGLFYDDVDDVVLSGHGTYILGGEGYITRVNPDDLSIINTIDISGFVNYGVNAIVRLNNIIYVGETTTADYSEPKRWYSFDSNFNFIKEVFSFPTTDFKYQNEDATVYDDTIIVCDHAGFVRFFGIQGDGNFVEIKTIDTSGLWYEAITNVGNSFSVWESGTGVIAATLE